MTVQYFSAENKQLWDNFVQVNALDGGLLQSWAWGDFKLSIQHQVWRLAVLEQEEILLAAQIIKEALPGGFAYFYCPRGPVFKQKIFPEQKQAALSLLSKELKNLAGKEKAIFIRYEPTSPPIPVGHPELVSGSNEMLKPPPLRGRQVQHDKKREALFRKGPEVQPRQTLVLDLIKSEGELLEQTKSKTRYNISVAQKHNLVVRVETNISETEFKAFWQLQQQTARRQGIHLHNQEYYRQMLKVLGEQNVAKLYLAQHQGRTIAANIVVYCGQWVYYLHGASSDADKNLMAPYLLQWQAMLDAKAAGKKFYDFWGVSDIKKSWAGITRFKQGFVPEIKFTTYAGCWDYPISKWWYWCYRVFKNFKS